MKRSKPDNERTVKLAIVRGLEQAVKYKQAYESLAQGTLGLIGELLHYCEKNHIEIPDEETYQRIVKVVQTLVLPTVTGHPHPPTEDGTLSHLQHSRFNANVLEV